MRLAAPASPYPRLGLPPLFSPSQEQAPLGESLGQSVRVSLRGPGGRLAGRPGLEGEGTGEGAWRQAAEAPQQSSGPCHFASAGTADGWGTRAQPPLPLPGSPGRGRRAGAGFVVPGPFHVVCSLSFPQQPNPAPVAWARGDCVPKPGRAAGSVFWPSYIENGQELRPSPLSRVDPQNRIGPCGCLHA